MISYQPFYETLFSRGMTEYALIFKHGIPSNTLHRMKHGKPITTTTLDVLCTVLECKVSDILEYIPPDKIWGQDISTNTEMPYSFVIRLS